MSNPARPGDQIPPLTRSHQAALADLLARVGGEGPEAAILAALVEGLPRLRAGLPGHARERVEALDANELALLAALRDCAEAAEAYAALAPASAGATALIDPARLRRLSGAAGQLAEASGEVALRASARAAMLE